MVKIRVIGIESPIHHAVRLGLMDIKQVPAAIIATQKGTEMNTTTQASKRKPRRMLEMHEIVKIGDWLRQPESIRTCRTYQQVADAINTAGLNLRESVTAANAEGMMKAAGLQLYRDIHPVEVQEALELLARIMIKSYDGVDTKAEIEQLRHMFGGA